MRYLVLVFLLAVACDDGGRDWDDDGSSDGDGGPVGCTESDVDDCDEQWAECAEHHLLSTCSADRCDCLKWNECDEEWADHNCDVYN